MSTPPFYFEAGYALYHKRPSRPFPPPFLSLPSTSFSEPLSTHHKSRDRRPKVNGEMIRGVTNGDDAVLVSDYFIGANDGVGAWATKEKGHAAYVTPFAPCFPPPADHPVASGRDSSSTSGPERPSTPAMTRNTSPTPLPIWRRPSSRRSRRLPSPTHGTGPPPHAPPC